MAKYILQYFLDLRFKPPHVLLADGKCHGAVDVIMLSDDARVEVLDDLHDVFCLLIGELE